MRRPMARSATIEPMLPQPMTPSVLAKISTPMNLFFSHLPARVEVSASGIWRAKRQHQRDGVFGGGDGIAERRVHHDDAARGRRRNVDIVDADAGAPDDLQILGIFEDLGRHLGGRANGEAVVIADQRGEFLLVLAERGLEIDLDAAILEDLHGGGRQSVGDENFGHGDCCFILNGFGLPFISPRSGGRKIVSVTPPSAARPWPRRRPSRARA